MRRKEQKGGRWQSRDSDDACKFLESEFNQNYLGMKKIEKGDGEKPDLLYFLFPGMPNGDLRCVVARGGRRKKEAKNSGKNSNRFC